MAFQLNQLELTSTGPTSVGEQVSRGSFMSNNIHLVPVFCESNVHSFFIAFERIATALQWPQDMWCVMLLCKLTGKAQEVCSALSMEDCLVYEKLKSAVLQAHELLPEAYRQNFRGLGLAQGQSYLDFAREKAKLFDRWCSASQVNDVGGDDEWADLEEPEGSLLEYKLEDIRESMESLYKRLERSRQMQTVLRAFEARDRNLLEDNLWRVSFWSCASVVVMLCVALTQVYTVRKLFDDKRRVRT
ncbi:uncharacterized protein LOC120727985 [Simochromis diagramma]|uniref:uncharacterized protein LOC120727985 n=1 Tax=Simochromis diagramma TaxID=43689 RepID=UPI001A7E2639|nr:uncharacterized protein LOC120727985 [Simochromis diagramma]